jgi:hypothetical protein
MVNADVDAVMGLRSQITALHHQIQTTYSNEPQRFQLATNAFPLLGKQKWDIGMAVHADFRALGYSVGDIVFGMIDDGRMANIFAQHHAYFEIPEYYKE